MRMVLTLPLAFATLTGLAVAPPLRAAETLATARGATDVAQLLPGAEGRWRLIIEDAETLGVAAPEEVVAAALEAALAAPPRLIAAAVAARPRATDRIAEAAALALGADAAAVELVAQAAFGALWASPLSDADKLAETLETLAALISVSPTGTAHRLAAIAAAFVGASDVDAEALLLTVETTPFGDVAPGAERSAYERSEAAAHLIAAAPPGRDPTTPGGGPPGDRPSGDPPSGRPPPRDPIPPVITPPPARDETPSAN